MNDPIDINSKRTFKSKFKKFWNDNGDLVVGITVLSVITLGFTALSVYSYKIVAKAMIGLPTVTNEGPKSLYQLGGPNSPLKFELTDALAAAYNRTGDAVNGAKRTLGGGLSIKAAPSDMAAWNYVASMTNDFIAQNGSISGDLITSSYLTKI